MEHDDLILEWLDFPYEAGRGFNVIPYTNGVYIVLEKRYGLKPKYIGWFAVSERPLNNPQYKLCCEREGLFLSRAICDDLPEESR